MTEIMVTVVCSISKRLWWILRRLWQIEWWQCTTHHCHISQLPDFAYNPDFNILFLTPIAESIHNIGYTIVPHKSLTREKNKDINPCHPLITLNTLQFTSILLLMIEENECILWLHLSFCSLLFGFSSSRDLTCKFSYNHCKITT